MAGTSNGSSLPLPASLAVSVAILITVLFGGVWTIMQSGFASLEKNIEATDRRYSDADVSMKEELEVLRRQTSTNSSTNSESIQQLTDWLHNRVVGQAEFSQFEARLESVVKHVDAIEATRPTTGELKGASEGLSSQLGGLRARIDLVESRIFDTASKSVRNPVEASELTSQINAINKQLDLLQQQIIELNRQVAGTVPRTSPH